MTDATLHWKGRDWHPTHFAACMAFDALRLALGDKPHSFTPEEIVAWLEARAALIEERRDMTGKRNPQLDAPEQTGAQKSESFDRERGMQPACSPSQYYTPQESLNALRAMWKDRDRTARLLAAAKGALHVLDTFTIDDFMEGKDAMPRAELLGAIRGFEPEFSP